MVNQNVPKYLFVSILKISISKFVLNSVEEGNGVIRCSQISCTK